MGIIPQGELLAEPSLAGRTAWWNVLVAFGMQLHNNELGLCDRMRGRPRCVGAFFRDLEVWQT